MRILEDSLAGDVAVLYAHSLVRLAICRHSALRRNIHLYSDDMGEAFISVLHLSNYFSMLHRKDSASKVCVCQPLQVQVQVRYRTQPTIIVYSKRYLMKHDMHTPITRRTTLRIQLIKISMAGALVAVSLAANIF